jgi:hypothetical protein
MNRKLFDEQDTGSPIVFQQIEITGSAFALVWRIHVGSQSVITQCVRKIGTSIVGIETEKESGGSQSTPFTPQSSGSLLQS